MSVAVRTLASKASADVRLQTRATAVLTDSEDGTVCVVVDDCDDDGTGAR